MFLAIYIFIQVLGFLIGLSGLADEFFGDFDNGISLLHIILGIIFLPWTILFLLLFLFSMLHEIKIIK